MEENARLREVWGGHHRNFCSPLTGTLGRDRGLNFSTVLNKQLPTAEEAQKRKVLKKKKTKKKLKKRN